MVDAGVELLPEPDRVIARLFLPGETTPGGGSRTEAVLNRVFSASAEEVSREAHDIIDRFGERHTDLRAILRENAAVVQALDARPLSPEMAIVVGAAFTAEHAVEGAALCNPSAVRHPDQSGLIPGQLRVLLSLRSIGESHLSSIQFCDAIIGPGRTWAFAPRQVPLSRATVTEGEWDRGHLLRALEHDGRMDELVYSIGQSLPEHFGSAAIEEAVQELRVPFMRHPDARAQLDAIRIAASSAYRATFPPESAVSARVLLPAADEESHGMEDVRLVEFSSAGEHEYRGTYTAYDGRSIASRLFTTSDFATFAVHRLTGAPSNAKGMALFPRPVGGEVLALSRGDGESISLSRSSNGLDWGPEQPVHRPDGLWDVVQSGNCGSPIETAEGWLVLTHGVGPMRVYSLGAILLDLDDPTRVVAVLPMPLLEPAGSAGDGYVPNVVYSCGGIVHDGVLWIPHGVADDRIRVASIDLATLLGAMRPALTLSA